jgi:hypothetical protein
VLIGNSDIQRPTKVINSINAVTSATNILT